MLNEEKIRLMTKAASFEVKEGKKALSMNKYFRGDYISLNLIGAWICFTIAFVLCGALWVFYNMTDLMENLHKMDLMGLGKKVLLLYVILLGIFLILNYLVYHLRYQNNQKKLAVYNKLLKRISHIYQMESKSGSGALTSEGAKENDDLTGI